MIEDKICYICKKKLKSIEYHYMPGNADIICGTCSLLDIAERLEIPYFTKEEYQIAAIYHLRRAYHSILLSAVKQSCYHAEKIKDIILRLRHGDEEIEP